MAKIDEIKERIAKSIKESCLTHQEIANKIHTNRSAVSQYATKRTLPSLDTLSELCKELDLDANYILCID